MTLKKAKKRKKHDFRHFYFQTRLQMFTKNTPKKQRFSLKKKVHEKTPIFWRFLTFFWKKNDFRNLIFSAIFKKHVKTHNPQNPPYGIKKLNFTKFLTKKL